MSQDLQQQHDWPKSRESYWYAGYINLQIFLQTFWHINHRSLLICFHRLWYLSAKSKKTSMAKMAHASQSAARLLHRRYGGALADRTALHRMQACKCFLTAVVTALCLARLQPNSQVANDFLNSPYKRANFCNVFLIYDRTTGKTPVLVLCNFAPAKSVNY